MISDVYFATAFDIYQYNFSCYSKILTHFEVREEALILKKVDFD